MPPKQQKRGGTPVSGKSGHQGPGNRHNSNNTKSGSPSAGSGAKASGRAETPSSSSNTPEAKATGAKATAVVRNVDYSIENHGGGRSLLDEVELQIRQELKCLDDYLHTKGKVRLAIAKDGACLFRSMSQALFSIQSLHYKVREACVDYLLSHEDDYLYFIDIKADMSDADAAHEEYLAYANKLRGPTAWGGQVEIQALSQRYNCNFEIYQALPRRLPSDDSTETMATHEISITKINNDHPKTVFLAYSHGNHYDVVLDVEEIERLAYYQKLVHHTIDTFFQSEIERKDYFLRNLAFEQSTDPLTPAQALESYDNRQWKIWQGQLQKEKSSDEQMARRIIAEETGTADADDSAWSIAGKAGKSKNKKKNKNSDALALQQAERLSAIRQASPSHSDLDAQLARSLDKDLNAPTSVESSQEQMDADERLARELADEQMALQLSRELNPDASLLPAQTTIPGGIPVKDTKSKSPMSTKSPTSHSTTTASHSATTHSSTDDPASFDDDGFVPSSKKARSLAAKASAAAKKQAEAEAKRKELERENAAKREKEAADKAKAAAATANATKPAPSNSWSSIIQATVRTPASSDSSKETHQSVSPAKSPAPTGGNATSEISSSTASPRTETTSKPAHSNSAKNKTSPKASSPQGKPNPTNESSIVSIPIGTGPVEQSPTQTSSKDTEISVKSVETPAISAEPTSTANTVSTTISPTASEPSTVAPPQNKKDEQRSYEPRNHNEPSRDNQRNARQGQRNENDRPGRGKGPHSGPSHQTRGMGRGYPKSQYAQPVYAPVVQKRTESNSAAPVPVSASPTNSSDTTTHEAVSEGENRLPATERRDDRTETASTSSAPITAPTMPTTETSTSIGSTAQFDGEQSQPKQSEENPNFEPNHEGMPPQQYYQDHPPYPMYQPGHQYPPPAYQGYYDPRMMPPWMQQQWNHWSHQQQMAYMQQMQMQQQQYMNQMQFQQQMYPAPAPSQAISDFTPLLGAPEYIPQSRQ